MSKPRGVVPGHADAFAAGSDVETRSKPRAAAIRKRLYGAEAAGVLPAPCRAGEEVVAGKTGGAQDPEVIETAASRSAHSDVMLIDPGHLSRTLGLSFVGDPDGWVEPTSREDEERLAFIKRYTAAPGGLVRRHLVADVSTIERLSALKAEAPNGIRVVEVVERAALLSRHAGSPLRVPPILIVGEPGTGKSRMARRLAETLGSTLTIIDGGSTTDRGPIVGHDIGYRGAAPGLVARALLDGSTAAPLILFEEVDKVSSYNQGVRPLDALLPLLEPSTAWSFTDTFLSLPMRADGVLWVLTANSTLGLPRPLLDRVIVVDMSRLGRTEARQAIRRIFGELLVEHGLRKAELSDAAVTRLEDTGLHQARRALALALGPALAAGRSAPDAAEIARACALLDGPALRRMPRKQAAPRPPVGFVRFPSDSGGA